MTITDYISEIEFAATNVISVIWSEQTRIAELSDEIERIRDVVEQTYQRAIAFQESDDADDVMLGVGIYFENYFGNDKEIFHKTEEVEKLENQLPHTNSRFHRYREVYCNSLNREFQLLMGNYVIVRSVERLALNLFQTLYGSQGIKRYIGKMGH